MAVEVSGTGVAVPYLDASTDVFLAGGVRVRIERTKNEAFFADFRHADSNSAKIVGLVASNPLLTLLVFLHTVASVSANNEASLMIPLILDPTYKFTSNKDRSDYRAQYEKLGKLHDKASEASFTAARSYQDTFMAEIETDHAFAKLLRRGRSLLTLAEIKEAIADATGRNPRLREMLDEHRSDMSKHINSMRITNLILAYSDLAPAFESNRQILQSVPLNLPSDKEQIDTALSKFASMLRMATESLCLDCWYEHDNLPFMTSTANTRHVRLEPRCLNCGGHGLVHKAKLVFPQPLGKLLMESSNWFYELIVGHIAAQIPGVKNAFIHKKIHVYSSGNVSKGAEIDVAITTDNGKLYLVEVTKKSDANAILGDAQRKINLFRSLNLPFEKMAFVTAGTIDRYADLGPDLRVFSLKHMVCLPDFLGEWISNGHGAGREPRE